MGISSYRISADEVSLSINPENAVGFYAGGVVEKQFNDHFGLQAELAYNHEGTRLSCDLPGNEDYDAIKGVARINVDNLRLPILAKCHSTKKMALMAGPYLNVRTGLSVSLNDDVEALLQS